MFPKEWNPQNSDSPAIKPKPKPHFCATLFQFPIPEHKLMIPTKSAMIFGKELYGVVTLTDPNGLAWQVGLMKDGEGIWLHDGLQEFLDYYSVHYFYNLHFRYEGNSVFFVCICDSFGSEIDYPCNGQSRDVKHNEDSSIGDYNIDFWDINPPLSDHGLFVKHMEVTKDDEGIDILDAKPFITHGSSEGKPFSGDVGQRSPRKRDNFLCQQETGSPTKRCRNAASMGSVLYVDTHHTRSRTLEKEEQVDSKGLVNGNASERRKAKENKKPHPQNLSVNHEENAEMHVPKHLFYGKSTKLGISKETEKAVRIASMCKLENPSFMVILRPHNQKIVDVPTEFVKRHLSRCSDDIQLEVHDGTGEWLVRCISKFKNGSLIAKRIGKGWPRFSANNKLEVGDVCVFELMKNGNDTDVFLKVWIYRAADYVTQL